MSNNPIFGYGECHMVEYMEFIREDLSLLDTLAYAETEIACPVGRSDNIVMAIHEVEFGWEFGTVGDGFDGDVDTLNMHLAKKTKSAPAQCADPDVIAWFKRRLQMGAAGQSMTQWPIVQHFYPPILIANSKLYFGGSSTDDGTAYIRIGYTLRKVSRAELYDALVD